MTCRWVITSFSRYLLTRGLRGDTVITGVGQGWKDVQVLDLQSCSRPALRGVRPGTVSIPPCHGNARESGLA